MANATPDRKPLLLHHARRHAEDVKRVTRALDDLRRQGWPVNFASVARQAGVGRATLYRRADLRRLVSAARPADLPGGLWREP